MSFKRWANSFFGFAEMLNSRDEEIRRRDKDIAEKVDLIKDGLTKLSSAYYNGKAAEHAMDVKKGAGLVRPSGFWNTVEARGGGAEWVNVTDDKIRGAHSYVLTEVIGNSKTPKTRELDADGASVSGNMVIFMRYDRIVYAVHDSRLLSFELAPVKDLGEALAAAKVAK